MNGLKSKKLVIGVVAALAIVINDALGKPVSDDAMMKAIGILGVYILGQGIADTGKERAKVEADTIVRTMDDGPDWNDTAKMDAEDVPRELNG